MSMPVWSRTSTRAWMSVSAGLLLYRGPSGNAWPSACSANSRNLVGEKWVWASIRGPGVLTCAFAIEDAAASSAAAAMVPAPHRRSRL